MKYKRQVENTGILTFVYLLFLTLLKIIDTENHGKPSCKYLEILNSYNLIEFDSFKIYVFGNCGLLNQYNQN